jgi:serine/threonine protein kinase/WD40 repeat protein
MSTHEDPTPSINPVDPLIAAYIQAIEAGQVPNRRELLDRNPSLAEALLAFFADFDRMDRVAAPLRMADPSDETVAGETLAESGSKTLRYFGDYELLEEVAQGGMGIVYKARQTSLNRLVALKMVLAGAFASSKDVQRFRIEAEAAANLDHPHIVPIFEIGEHDGQQYYAMKFVEGTSLATHPRGTPREEVAGMVDVARAIDHAHRRGVLHRDLKPSNILVDADGSRLVTDFGLAKRLSDIDGSLTETGQLLGTPRYMSPEQASGRKDLTVTADVYSLGVILYERLSGRTPFLADNVVSLLHQVRESEPPRLSTITPGLGQDLETIARKCLDKDPTRRYPSAEALAIDLENWLNGRPILARPVGPISRTWRWCRRNPAIASLIATVAASLVAGTVVSILFALRAEAKAVEAGISATRSQLVIAEKLTVDTTQQIGEQVNPTLGLLTYARAFQQLPDDPKADDLRWFISANLALLGQRFHNLMPPLEGRPVTLTADAHSPDGKLYVGASPDGRIRIWDIATGQLRATFRDDRPYIHELQFSPDGVLLAAIQNYDWANINGTASTSLIYNGETKEDSILEIGNGTKNGVRLWDATTGLSGPLVEIPFHLNFLKFSPDHRLFATFATDFAGNNSDHVILWRSFDGKKSCEIEDPSSFRDTSLYTPDGRILLLDGGSEGSKVIALDTDRGLIRYQLDDAKLSLYYLTLSHSGREFALMWGDQIRFFDVESGQSIREPIKVESSQTIREPIKLDTEWFAPVPLANRPQGELPHTNNNRFLPVPNHGVFDLATGRKIEACDAGSNWNIADDSSLAIGDDGRRAIDLKTYKVLPRPIDGRFHPAVARLADLDRVYKNPSESKLWDKRTGLVLAASADFNELDAGILQSDKIIFNNIILLQISKRSLDEPFGILNVSASFDPVLWVPREAFATYPEVIQLWAEVLCRHKLVEETRTEPLGEAEWETRRQKLIEILPKSSSTILTEVAHDQWHWLKRELIETTQNLPYYAIDRDKELRLLNRVIAVDPHWWDYSQRAERHTALKHYNEAAADLTAAAKLEGDWFWDVAPEVLVTKMMDRLLVTADPNQILREELKLSDQAIDIAVRQLTDLRRSTKRTRDVARSVVAKRDQSASTYRIAYEFLRRKPDEHQPSVNEQLDLALANFRVGQCNEALNLLNKIDDKTGRQIGRVSGP